ncbi:MAG: AarF/ABC1/UbiB kinase family protein [Cellvibrionales bacterium]|nr:AarF/ABC1/UbiB kinase family protein [Cellvibrionales bacterium]
MGFDKIGRSMKRLSQTSFTANKLLYRWVKERDQDNFPTLLTQSFQELGCTYIKLGQLIASSPTIFPAKYVDAFQSCLDQTEPLPFDIISHILDQELGPKRFTEFESIDKEPLASASIAQVHAATLKTGEKVVLKIQKPTAKETLETDFQFLTLATKLVESFSLKAWKSSLLDIVSEIRSGMLEECDFIQEANNIALFQDFLENNNIKDVIVPTVYPHVSTQKVLVMERFFGVSLSDTQGVHAITKTPEKSLTKALDTWFLSLKQCQIYHADLHAGNVMMLKDGRIGFIDFGIVGKLSPTTWEGLTALAICIPLQNFDELAASLTKIGATSKAVDIEVFAKDLKDFWHSISNEEQYQTNEYEAIWRDILMQFSSISAKHGIRFPREFTLLVKQFLYFDRYISLLAPEIGMFDNERMDMIGLGSVDIM